MNDTFAFIFIWIDHMQRLGHCYEYAARMVSWHANEVIRAHNKAARDDIYWHETTHYTDNQCHFATLLRRDTVYQPIVMQHGLLINEMCAGCYTLGVQNDCQDPLCKHYNEEMIVIPA